MSSLINEDNVETVLGEYHGSDDFYEELNAQVAELTAIAVEQADKSDTKVVESGDLIDLTEYELDDT